MLTFRELQEQQRPWVSHNFPGRLDYFPLLGVMEELGELAHSHLKRLQGIRGTEQEHRESAEDAVGDIVIFLADYCTANGIDLQSAVEKTWGAVKRRDWRKNPVSGAA